MPNPVQGSKSNEVNTNMPSAHIPGQSRHLLPLTEQKIRQRHLVIKSINDYYLKAIMFPI